MQVALYSLESADINLPMTQIVKFADTELGDEGPLLASQM